MKTNKMGMTIDSGLNAALRTISIALIAGTTCALFNPAEAQDKALPNSENYIEYSLGYLDLDGNEAAYLKQHGIKKHAFGGIENFQYNTVVGKYTEFKLSGHALHDNSDYQLNLELVNEAVGYFEIEWKEFRTWYDGSGGYLSNGTFIDIYDDELAIDRGEFQINFGFTYPDRPRFDFSYRHTNRDGTKDSTSQADTYLVGDVPGGRRYIVPSFLDMDEERDIFDARVTGYIKKTEATFGIRLESSDVNNARKITRRPGEAAERRVTQRVHTDSDLFSSRLTTITQIGEKTRVTTGVLYTSIDTFADGGRIISAAFDSVFDPTAPGQAYDHGFHSLDSRGNIDEFVINANLMFLPKKDLKAILSVRIDDRETDSANDVIETSYSRTTSLHEPEELAPSSRSDWNDITGKAELIYTGVENAIYNASLLYQTGDGDLDEQEILVETGELDYELKKLNDRDVIKAVLGAKFYPSREHHTYWQYYHKERNNDFEFIIDPTANNSRNRFPAFIDMKDFTVDDFNVRWVWKPIRGLNCVSRFDIQNSKVETRSEDLARIQSGDLDTKILSQTISWAGEKIFLQGSLNIVNDSIKTPSSNLTGAAERLAGNFDNDYWTANIVAQWAIDETSDMILQAYYFRSDNYMDVTDATVPYGSDLLERGATATWGKDLNESTRLLVRYGYHQSVDYAAGGYNDYKAQVLTTSLRYRF